MYSVRQAMETDLERILEIYAYAREFTKTALAGNPKADLEHPYHYEMQTFDGSLTVGGGSRDVSDVSWVCPTAQVKTADRIWGTPGHSWQVVSQGLNRYSMDCTMFAAKVLGATAAELLSDADLLARAKEEHTKRVGPKGYECPIPKDIVPRSMESLRK